MTFIKPEENGKINLEELESLIRKDTSIVSIMAVNNEIGVSQVNFLRIVRDNLKTKSPLKMYIDDIVLEQYLKKFL